MSKIHYELIRDLMLHLGRSYGFVVDNCNAETATRIESLPLPMNLKRVFQWTWINDRQCDFGVYRLDKTSDIFSTEWFERLIRSNMLEIGSACNGDNLILKFSSVDCEVGLLNGSRFAGEEEDTDPEAFYVKVCGSLDELLLRLAEKQFLPYDYVSAQALADLKSEIEKEKWPGKDLNLGPSD